MEVLEKPKSVLDPVRHKRLIEDLDHICVVANVPKQYVQQTMVNTCTAKQVDWVVNYRLYKDTYPGFVLESTGDTEAQCMAMVGALVRNFIDARVVTLSTLLSAAEKGDIPEPTVMVIPNLYMSSYGKTLPAWKVAAVYDMLITRWTANKPTVIAVESIDGVQQAYGLAFAQHLKNYKR